MAGKQIYTGNMLESMEVKISSLQTSMGTMSGDMASMVAEIIAVKDVIGQGVSVVNVKSGDTKAVPITDVDVLKNVDTNNIFYIYMTCKCNGYVKGNITISNDTETSRTFLYYNINGGAKLSVGVSAGTIDTLLNFDVPVKDGDILGIGIARDNASNAIIRADSFMSYELVDIVNDGALIVA